ncbi:MAG: hypothetical protein M1833_002966 [Piccolia ochrophora]|nr:MAG: hypothetical protein M1833_002966 [Piccolia ochrophora]
MRLATFSVVSLAAVVSALPSVKRQDDEVEVVKSCKPGFKNVVYNTMAPCLPDWPNRWYTVKKYSGIDGWVSFYSDAISGSEGHDEMNDSQLRQVMSNTPEAVKRGLEIFTGAVEGEKQPEYLALLNEPDLGVKDYIKPISPQQSADMVELFLAEKKNSSVKLLPPSIGHPMSDYLQDFFEACKCEDQFDILPVHIYHWDTQVAKNMIRLIHERHENKTIWVTELSPGSGPEQNCTLTMPEIIDWMNIMIKWCNEQDYVDKVYWNSGEFGVVDGDDPTKCNPSLTTYEGKPNEILKAYGELCSDTQPPEVRDSDDSDDDDNNKSDSTGVQRNTDQNEDGDDDPYTTGPPVRPPKNETALLPRPKPQPKGGKYSNETKGGGEGEGGDEEASSVELIGVTTIEWWTYCAPNPE